MYRHSTERILNTNYIGLKILLSCICNFYCLKLKFFDSISNRDIFVIKADISWWYHRHFSPNFLRHNAHYPHPPSPPGWIWSGLTYFYCSIVYDRVEDSMKQKLILKAEIWMDKKVFSCSCRGKSVSVF